MSRMVVRWCVLHFQMSNTAASFRGCYNRLHHIAMLASLTTPILRLCADLLLLESPWPCPTGREPRPTEAFPLLLAWQLEYILSGWWFQPLWKYCSAGIIIPNIWKKNDPNHQPVIEIESNHLLNQTKANIGVGRWDRFL